MIDQARDAIFIIDHVFSSGEIDQQHADALNLVSRLKESSPEAIQAVLQHYQQATLPKDQAFSLRFFLFDLTGEQRFLQEIADMTARVDSLRLFNEIFWNIGRRLFTAPSVSIDTTPIRHCLAQIADHTKKIIAPPRARPQAIRNVAILSPQILSMRHSPSREAINIALHLMEHHGCDVTIYNTNSMSKTNYLSILNAYNANHFPELKGEQELTLSYMGFKDKKIKINSFAPTPLSTGKIQEIVLSLAQNQTDAIIAHGENLAIQECLYQSMPSLFVTTGDTVPYAHSDAYWVPGNLFSETSASLAKTFGHKNFLLETMITTPEGQAEAVADRRAFNLGAEDFVYLVAGVRLDRELTADFAQACQRILERNSHSKIIFSGTPNLELQSHFAPGLIAEQRVINIGFQGDFAAICAMSDAYLNPFRHGDGTSSQTAILNDLPIITRNHGHISAIVPDSRSQPSWPDYIDYAAKLAGDRGFLDDEIALFKAHYHANLNTADQVAKIFDQLNVTLADYQ